MKKNKPFQKKVVAVNEPANNQSTASDKETNADAYPKFPEILNRNDLLDKQDVLFLLKIHERTLQRYRSNGKIIFTSLEGKILYPESLLLMQLTKKLSKLKK